MIAVATMSIGLLPVWNIQVVPEATRRAYKYRYSHPGFLSKYEELVEHRQGVAYSREAGLALHANSEPGDSLVTGSIEAIGYYSELVIHDRFGLVDWEIARWVVGENDRKLPLRSPGHDVKVSRDFFLERHPTFLFFDAIESDTMRSRVLAQAKAWRELGSLWRRYAPDFFILDGRPGAETTRLLIVFSAIEDLEDPALLPRAERRCLRAERTESFWSAFYERARLLHEVTVSSARGASTRIGKPSPHEVETP